MAVYNYDVVVLGSGPAGEGAAMNAAKAGRKVAMVDSRRQVGGNCTHLGTIPSKALRHSVRQIMQFNTNPMFRAIGEPRWFESQILYRHAAQKMHQYHGFRHSPTPFQDRESATASIVHRPSTLKDESP